MLLRMQAGERVSIHVFGGSMTFGSGCVQGTGTIDSAAAAKKCAWSARFARPKYSNSTEHFKRPKNRDDGSDLDENLTESIAAPKTFI